MSYMATCLGIWNVTALGRWNVFLVVNKFRCNIVLPSIRRALHTQLEKWTDIRRHCPVTALSPIYHAADDSWSPGHAMLPAQYGRRDFSGAGLSLWKLEFTVKQPRMPCCWQGWTCCSRLFGHKVLINASSALEVFIIIMGSITCFIGQLSVVFAF